MAILYPHCILLGDSLIEDVVKTQHGFCFVGELEQLFNRRLDVFIRRMCGYNSSQALAALLQLISSDVSSSSKLKYILILLGSNDACISGKQHVLPEEYRANMEAIIDHPTIQAHHPKILLVTPPPLDDISHAACEERKGRLVIRKASTGKQYSDIAREVAKKKRVVLIDLYEALMNETVEGRPGHLLTDGLHMNGKAYKIFYDLVSV